MYKGNYIAGSYRVGVLNSLLDDINFSMFNKGSIIASVIKSYIDYFKGNVKKDQFLYEISDYTEFACKQLPILYPILSSFDVSEFDVPEYEKSLILNLAVIFGCRKTIRTAIRYGSKQNSFFMTKPVSLKFDYLYPINFAYYNGDVETANLLVKFCERNVSYIRHKFGNTIKVIVPEFTQETILVNFFENNKSVKQIAHSLNIKFPYLSTDNDAKQSVLKVLINRSNIKQSIEKGNIPQTGLMFKIDFCSSKH